MEGTSESLISAAHGAEERSAADEAEQKPIPNGKASGENGGAARRKLDGGAGPEVRDRPKAVVNLQSLLKAGVHFGHQSSRWHPNMEPFIYTTRNGIHIIDLPKTIQSWKQCRGFIVETAARGGNVLFVGTKKQAQDAIIEEAKRCGAFYVARRWLGGMLTNFRTIRNSIERMKKLEALLGDEEQRARYKKKELLMMDREREKLEFSLAGIRDMYAAPQLMFVIDTKREDIAVKEAQRLDIPVVALVDTNSDPTVVEYPIPSNDDATRAIRLFCQAVADAVIEGREIYAQRARSARAVDQAAAEAAAEAAAAVAESSEEKAAGARAGDAGDAGEGQ